MKIYVSSLYSLDALYYTYHYLNKNPFSYPKISLHSFYSYYINPNTTQHPNPKYLYPISITLTSSPTSFSLIHLPVHHNPNLFYNLTSSHLLISLSSNQTPNLMAHNPIHSFTLVLLYSRF